MTDQQPVSLIHIVPLTRGQKALMKSIHQPLVDRRGIFVYRNYADFLEDFKRVVKDKLPPVTQQIERSLASKHVYENLGLFVVYADPALLQKGLDAVNTKKEELKQRKGKYNPDLLKSVFADKEFFIPEEDFKTYVKKIEGPKIININSLAKKLGVEINDTEPAIEQPTAPTTNTKNNVVSSAVDTESLPNNTKQETDQTTVYKNLEISAQQLKKTNVAADKFLVVTNLIKTFPKLKEKDQLMQLANQLIPMFSSGDKNLPRNLYRDYSDISSQIYKIIREL